MLSKKLNIENVEGGKNMNMKRSLLVFMTFILVVMCSQAQVFAEEKGKEDENKFEVPNSVLNISKENTYPNPSQDFPYLQPSELAEELIETTDVDIENPDLIRILNESNISTTPLAIGYRANIYLGQWPLSYESSETSINWEYKEANVNQLDNRGGNQQHKIKYVQEQEKKITGDLTSKINNAEEVKKMMMIKAMEKTKLPLAFETFIGKGTKKGQVYNVAPKNIGYLYGYAPAVNERGKVTFGEVYLQLKGSKKKLVIKNVTQQGIGAWIPVQDHLSFQFHSSETPR
jgi:hypothetical protein